ncbi:MAG: dipeptide ABC transporter ATP-binding protein [Albidovulum sp.]|nr:dipeptide ABC transporter ATP-binding protein [Albidovulum sp.]MDE0533928.1 dipeptide ABC transporter ATP-binding protein [Albidovulum sp.]
MERALTRLLNISDLNLSIHGEKILDEISFEIGEGETFGIVGESGSGKSLTALSIIRLLPGGSRVSGTAELEGRNLLRASEKELCAVRGGEIGVIFQEPMTALNPVKTIGDQVAETLTVHGRASRNQALAIAREKLNRVELPPEEFPLTKFPHELSGGQRQRVCIALAIALRPKLLIADEPTTALDVSTQAQILKLLKSLVDEDGMSLMLITHDLAVVAGIADHVAVMHGGRIVEAGATEALFRRMRHPYTKKLFAASSHAPKRYMVAEQSPLLQVTEAVREYTLPKYRIFARAPKRRAVDFVSFAIRRNESLGLVGESGCGKSTLTRAVLGLEPLQHGRIDLEGEPVLADSISREQRRKMQVVFQDPYSSFNPRHRVERLVAEPFYLVSEKLSRSEIRDRVALSLETVGLRADDMAKYIHEFSGGQRQRIAIARALVIRPKLIILDEAVSALDVSIRAQILDLLAELRKLHGLSYLFISHDLTVVSAITDRVLVMRKGKIVEEGETRIVFDSPRHSYTQHLLASAPVIPPEWKQLEAASHA